MAVLHIARNLHSGSSEEDASAGAIVEKASLPLDKHPRISKLVLILLRVDRICEHPGLGSFLHGLIQTLIRALRHDSSLPNWVTPTKPDITAGEYGVRRASVITAFATTWRVPLAIAMGQNRENPLVGPAWLC